MYQEIAVIEEKKELTEQLNHIFNLEKDYVFKLVLQSDLRAS